MAPLDWDNLMSLDLQELEKDEDALEDLMNVLSEFNLGDESDSERLRKLFEVTRTVMVLKDTQLEEIQEDVAESMQKEAKISAEKDKEIAALKSENDSLSREIRSLERQVPQADGKAHVQDTRVLREELEEMEKHLMEQQKELREKGRQLDEEKKASDKYRQRAEDSESECRGLRAQVDQNQDDMRDLQRQLDFSRASNLAAQDDNEQQRKDKLKLRNAQIYLLQEENERLTQENEAMEKKMKDSEQELREGQEEMEKTTDEYLRMKNIYDKCNKDIDDLKKENALLKDQVEDLMEQARTKTDADDEIMVQVNNKVEEWKAILAEKDDEILDLRHQVMQLREDLIAANIDSEKTSVAMLTKAVEDRDKQIEDLRKRLDEAVSDLEANTALIDDVRSEMSRAGKGPNDKLQLRIRELTSTIKHHESHVKDAETRVTEAETDAQEKDKDLNEALERMRQYEAGEYGLAEAVDEIKDLKDQIKGRDREIEDLTQYINRCEEKINDICDENEEFREKLGLEVQEPIDLGEYRKKKAIRVQQDRALNRVLQKEIETLEEERIELKDQVRKLAQGTGQRAVALGLGADDMEEVNNFMEELKQKKRRLEGSRKFKPDGERDDLRIRNTELERDTNKKQVKLETLSQQNAELRTKNRELEELTENLEKGMREFQEGLQEHSPSDGREVHDIQCPTLDRLLAAIEAKNLMGKYDTSLFLKERADNLKGHNEELRKELREIRVEATKANVDLEKANSKVTQLEGDVKMLREAGAGAFFQTMALPEGMAVTSSDVIASLNEHLVQVLQELSLKENMIENMESGLDNYRRKFAVMRHQQGLLYQDHSQEKKKWDEEHERLLKELKTVEGHREEEQVKIQEFDRLVDTLAKDEVEVRRRLADMTRKTTVLRVNEKALTRRYNALQEVEGSLRKTNSKLRNDMIAMETAVAERLGYLQRYKDMASFKIAALQKNLEGTVAAKDLENANKKYTELTEKYRDLLEKSNSLVSASEANSGYELEVKRLNDETNELKQELGIEKEKLHTLEAAFDSLKKQGMASTRDLTSNEVVSISKKMTTLEMKELNERQRAEHASRMYERQRKQLAEMEDRNFELERKFAELTRMHLDQQKVERELRDELAESVTKSVSDADRKRIDKLEESDAKLKLENSKLKEISEVATMQVTALEAQQQSHDKELTSLRQQLIDFQAQSDENTVIGKLHRQIVQLQVSEGTAVRRLEQATKRINKIESQLLRTEQKVDDKDQTIYHNRQEARNKSRCLKRNIQDMRMKYAGAVPLQQQEKFSQQMVKLQEDKKTIEEDLRKTNSERVDVEDKLAELEIQHKGLQDLIVTLKDGKGAQKVAEWHGKMEALRVEDLRIKREVIRLKQQMKFQDSVLKKHEQEIIGIDEEKIRLTREFEEREIQWEQRETELERIIEKMERQQAEIAGAANQFEAAVGALPDTSWPVAKQLEHAVSTIKRNVKLILDAKAEAEFFKKRIEELEQEVKQREKEVLSRDRVITELRLRMPASSERDNMILKATAKGQALNVEEDYESQKAVRVAQSTVTSLQARLAQKEETIQKFQDLLKQAREDMTAMNRRHDEDMTLMHEKLHSKNDAAFIKFKQDVQDALNKQQTPIPSNQQLRRLSELEDVVAEQDNSMAALRNKLTRARQETTEWKYKYEDALRQQADDKDSLIAEKQEEIGKVHHNMQQMRKELEDKDREMALLNEELDRQKEINTRAPTTALKNLVERLKNDLALKEKQHKALSKALMDLRADMVNQAQEDVKAHADHAAIEHNIQKIVEKKTREAQDRVDELETHNQKLKKDMRKRREKESVLNTELDEVKEDLVKRETQVKKLKDDKSRLESDVDELEKKVERMSTMQKQKGPVQNVQQEVEELRRKNRILHDELRRCKHQPEKPYEQQAKDGKDPSTGEQLVAKWEESKKWQKMVDRQKSRLKDKEQEIEKLTKSNELLKNALERANKDKENLETKLRAASRAATAVGSESPVVARKQAWTTAAAVPAPMSHNVQELKKQNHELHEENTNLRRQLTVGHEAALEEVQLRNRFLTDKLEQLEQGFAQRMSSSLNRGLGSEAYKELAQKDHNLQKQVIQMSEENLELRFEVEQAKKDIPRLKERIDDLQKYVEVLKAEKEQLQLMGGVGKSLSTSFGSNASNVKRIGESGKTNRELEKTVALLKKVVERTQTENEQLKKTPGVISNEQLRNLQMENRGLKNQLEDMRQKMGASLSERYVSQQKGTARLMNDYEKLRKELGQEKETNEKLRLAVRQQQMGAGQLKRELEGTQQKLEIEEAKKPTLASMDSKGWKSVVVTRMYEEKLKALEEDLQKKNKMLADIKVLLRESSEREQDLIHERDDLLQKVNILERFPPGALASDKGLVREYQTTRLTVDRLENEKKELMYEVQVLRKQVNPEAGGPTDISDDVILQKVGGYDRLLSENVEMRTQLKATDLEKHKLEREIDKLKVELANFGPEFFEEIEDLKYNYREAVQKNVQYEDQLQQLSKQFGVTVNISSVA